MYNEIRKKTMDLNLYHLFLLTIIKLYTLIIWHYSTISQNYLYILIIQSTIRVNVIQIIIPIVMEMQFNPEWWQVLCTVAHRRRRSKFRHRNLIIAH